MGPPYVYGHALTALRYPELELVTVPARRVYVEKGGPFRERGQGSAPVDWAPGRALARR